MRISSLMWLSLKPVLYVCARILFASLTLGLLLLATLCSILVLVVYMPALFAEECSRLTGLGPRRRF